MHPDADDKMIISPLISPNDAGKGCKVLDDGHYGVTFVPNMKLGVNFEAFNATQDFLFLKVLNFLLFKNM